MGFLKRYIFISALLSAPVLPVTAQADDSEQIITMVSTDHPDFNGRQAPITALMSSGEFNGIRFNGQRFPLGDIGPQGAVLWKTKKFGIDFRVFKLKRGWPENVASPEEDPRMDSGKSDLGKDGGFLTLTYLYEGGLISNQYRHLRLKVQCSQGRCSIFTADGRPADRLFAKQSSNEKGIAEVSAVGRASFAQLTGEHALDSAKIVQNMDKGPWVALGTSADSLPQDAGAGVGVGAGR